MWEQGMSRRRFLQVAGAAAAWGLAPGTSRAWAQAQEVLRNGTFKFPSSGANFIAQRKGYFAKMGIRLDDKFFSDGAFVIAPLAAGELDVGGVTCSAGWFNAIARGGTFKGFLDRGQSKPGFGATAICVRRDLHEDGLKTVKDLHRLKGKRVAVGAPGSVNQYGMANALQIGGLDPRKDVQWTIGLPQPEIVKLFGVKAVEAADLAYSIAYRGVTAGTLQIIAFQDEFLPNAQLSVIAAQESLIEKKRDVLVRYAAAYIQGARDFEDFALNPRKRTDVIQILTETTFETKPEGLIAQAPRFPWLATNGVPNVDSIVAQQNYWADYFDLVKTKVPRERLMELTLVQDALRILERDKPFGG